jgi:hypothetical protein
MVDPEAVAALEKMGAALRSHQMFEVNAQVSTEDVLANGQKLTYDGAVQIHARRPDRFHVSMKSDVKHREIYYDGKSLTMHSPRQNVHASMAAPPTIMQTIEMARSKYGIDLPLADLFTWGTDPAQAQRLTSGFLVRPETIGGRMCDHYAFRQPGVDWQVWIQQGESPVPCKLLITKTDDPSRPTYSSVMNWTFPVSLADNMFAFTPPAGSQKIEFMQQVAAAGAP